MRDHGRIISFFLVLAAFAVSGVALAHLPAIVPTHRGISGEPDQFGSRAEGACRTQRAAGYGMVAVGLVAYGVAHSRSAA